MKKYILFFLGLVLIISLTNAQTTQKTTDTNTPLYLLPPDYPMPYDPPKPEEIKAVLDRIYGFVDSCTPTKLINKNSKSEISDYGTPDS
ncbi:MAG TPA: glycosyl hydrolase, partial [Bacteroidales bacterium]